MTEILPTQEPQFTPCSNGDTYTIAGKEFPITGYYNFEGTQVPLVDIPMMSDYKWQLDCLNSRLEHPEYYRDSEDVEKQIAYLRKWLAEHEPD